MNGHLSQHLAETDLALYASGDLPVWHRLAAGWHVRGCSQCRALVQTYRLDRDRLQQSAGQVPEDVDWDQLSAEMTANIHVGLAAGECVSPRAPRVAALSWWRPVAAAAGILVLVSGAWWLNIPKSDTETIGRALYHMATGDRGTQQPAAPAERGSMVGASPSGSGVELVENGGSLGIEQRGLQPVMYSISTQGSASARYVDQDTGQVTITAVYVQ
ncbi:MAG TPA: hypothetical protein VGJ09_16850 [Bryobacteraceae bacterium]|jgi:hypothetical protein